MRIIRANYDLYRNAVGILVMEPSDNGHLVWDEFTIHTKFVESGALIGNPTLTLGKSDAQLLLDALVEAGLRPSKLEPLEPTVAAMKSHIHFAEHVATKLLEKRK